MIPRALNLSQFAEYMETIKMLYQVDDDFRTLCDDYLVSKDTLEKCEDRSLEDKQLELEYRRLSRNLEKEILDYIIKRSE